ncbi:uncharacterized protein LOC110449368 [Mizuhopecten yessoensis]|uniref:uncharacterized protein LOC110449368 n=1 Tax=Mizuhopecten yessoensis TaxID=6573 RepID=UPI000B45F09C|nr:uncharacterized protein LOC110449368 [Mizuhopecten yessoensis]
MVSSVQVEEAASALLNFHVCFPLLIQAKLANSPLDMDVYNQCAVNKLERWSRDPSGLITGTERIWHGAKGRSVYDDYMESIAVKFARNDLLISLMKEMVQAGGAKLVSHAEEHLPDGIYANPSTQAISAFNSIGDVTNDIIESTFGMTGR